MGSKQPFVSVLVPTADRHRFVPLLMHFFEYQTYPKDMMEMLVYDDGKESAEELFLANKDRRVRYIRGPFPVLQKHRTIGNMRNFLNTWAKGEIMVNMDDDDYYPPERVAHAVEMLKLSRLDIAGCSRAPIYMADEGYFINGYRHDRHSCAASMAFTREYLQKHRFDKTKACAEEPSFTHDFSEPMVQLDPKKTCVAINHGMNTFDKKKMIGPATRIYKPPIETVFKDPMALEFYRSMRKGDRNANG